MHGHVGVVEEGDPGEAILVQPLCRPEGLGGEEVGEVLPAPRRSGDYVCRCPDFGIQIQIFIDKETEL